MTDATQNVPADLEELVASLSEIVGRDLTVSEIIDIVGERTQLGVNVSFLGKQQARKIARLVRPRVQRSNAGLSVGNPEEQAKNLLIEGDNLQALASLYKAGEDVWTCAGQDRAHLGAQSTTIWIRHPADLHRRYRELLPRLHCLDLV